MSDGLRDLGPLVFQSLQPLGPGINNGDNNGESGLPDGNFLLRFVQRLNAGAGAADGSARVPGTPAGDLESGESDIAGPNTGAEDVGTALSTMALLALSGGTSDAAGAPSASAALTSGGASVAIADAGSMVSPGSGQGGTNQATPLTALAMGRMGQGGNRLAASGQPTPESALPRPAVAGEDPGAGSRPLPPGQSPRVFPMPDSATIAQNDQAFRLPAGVQSRLEGAARDTTGDVQRLLADARRASASVSREPGTRNEAPASGLLADDGLPSTMTSRLSPLPAGELPAIQRQAAAQTLDRIVVMSRTGIDHARLQLNPPELGRVDIRLDLDGNDTRLQLTVQNGTARESMEAMLPKLREALQQQGLGLLDASVSEHSDERSHGGKSEQDFEPESTGINDSVGRAAGKTGNHSSAAAAIEGLVNTYA